MKNWDTCFCLVFFFFFFFFIVVLFNSKAICLIWSLWESLSASQITNRHFDLGAASVLNAARCLSFFGLLDQFCIWGFSVVPHSFIYLFRFWKCVGAEATQSCLGIIKGVECAMPSPSAITDHMQHSPPARALPPAPLLPLNSSCLILAP